MCSEAIDTTSDETILGPWTMAEALKVLLAVLVAGPLVLGLIGVGALPGLDTSGSAPFWAAVTAVYYGVPAAAIAFVGHRKPGGIAHAAGLRPAAAQWLIGGAVLGVVIATAFNTFYTAVMTLLGLGPPEASMRVMEQLADSVAGGTVATLVSVMLVVLVAPLVEEVIFRGVLLSGLSQRFGPVTAIVISACVFAAVHFDPWRAVPLAFLGGVLGFLAWQSRSVWPAVLAHALVNGFAYFIASLMATG